MSAGMFSQRERVPATDVAAFQRAHYLLAEMRVTRPDRYIRLQRMSKVNQRHAIDRIDQGLHPLWVSPITKRTSHFLSAICYSGSPPLPQPSHSASYKTPSSP